MAEEYKSTVSLEERKKETERIRLMYPGKLPIYLEKFRKSALPQVGKNKCLAPMDSSMTGFIRGLRKKFTLDHTQGLFVFVNGNEVVTGDALISELYERKRNEDGFLYLIYYEHPVLGGN